MPNNQNQNQNQNKIGGYRISPSRSRNRDATVKKHHGTHASHNLPHPLQNQSELNKVMSLFQ